MSQDLTIEQRFALSRARYEVGRMSRPALEKTALRLLKTRMEQKNGIQNMLMSNGILFKVDEHAGPLPEILSEQTFIELLQMSDSAEDQMPTDIMDKGWEDDDLDEDDLMLM